MNLKELQELMPDKLELVRDGAFESFGILTTTHMKSLVFVEDEIYISMCLENPNITCILTTKHLADAIPAQYGLILSENPRDHLFTAHNVVARETEFYKMDFPNDISPDAKINPSAFIASQSVRIGAGSVIEAGARILDRTIIGEDTVIRSGCIIGTHGFEFRGRSSHIFYVEHMGGVKIGDRVEIQYNSTVDRALFAQYTTIGDDTKLDSFVHFGHASTIGIRGLIAAHSVVAGSSHIGDNVWIGPRTAISSGITIGNGARITIGSVVTRNVNPDEHVSGNFAVNHDKYIEFIKSIR